MINPKHPQTSTRQHGVTYRDAVVPKLPAFFLLSFLPPGFIADIISWSFLPTQDPYWNQINSPSWNVLGPQLFKKHTRFPWNTKFHCYFSNNPSFAVTCVTSIQPTTSNHFSLKSILILFSHLRVGFKNGLYPSGFPTKTLYEFLLRPHIRTTRPEHVIVFDLITRTTFGEKYKSWKPSLWNFLRLPVTSSVLLINIWNIYLFQTIPNRKHVRQMLTYPDSAIGFIKTHFY